MSRGLLLAGAQETININVQIMETVINGLYIVSTPIGNLDDISLRAQKILSGVDIIICENPSHSLKLLNKLGIKKKLLSLHDYNEDKLIKRIEKYQKNTSIALISDAGSPLISDPGYKLLQNYIKKDLQITTVPGPSSVISALQLSGLPINNFQFFGFIPKNKNSIMALVNQIKDLVSTSIFFISGNRLLDFLKTLENSNINKRIAVCKEITKKNEYVFRGFVKKIIKEISSDDKNFKGEFVIIVEGSEKKPKKLMNDTIESQINKLLDKFSLTEVVEIVHKLSNVSKNEIYKTTLILKK